MIDIDTSNKRLLIISPKSALEEEDFDRLGQAFDRQSEASGKTPNLVIRLDHLPHWEGLGALQRHFEFVKNHHKLVEKVAVVSDSAIAALAPQIADHFLHAKVRHFPASKFDQAIEWATNEKDDPGEFERLEGFPEDVIALRAKGIITAEDYRATLEPLMRQAREHHEKLKALIVFDDAFVSYEPAAVLEDSRFGLRHWNDFSKVALVTDIGWLRRAAQLFAPLVPYEFRVFGLDALDEARQWLCAESVAEAH